MPSRGQSKAVTFRQSPPAAFLNFAERALNFAIDENKLGVVDAEKKLIVSDAHLLFKKKISNGRSCRQS